uniref:Uncharacterized protein n=2 Tax=Rhodnius prolixus TaxID=13249 RepID=T1HXK5_RHOPR
MHLLNEERKNAEMNDSNKNTNADLKLKEQTNNFTDEQMWTLISRDASNDMDINGRDGQIIYLTLQDSGVPSEQMTEKLLIHKDDLEQFKKEQAEMMDEAAVEEEAEVAEQQSQQPRNDLNRIFVPTMHVIDEDGNPFKFSTDGTLFQVTTMDGEPLQVALGEDEHHFPLAITANGESIIHQIKPLTNIPIVGNIEDNISVASRTTDGIEFVSDEQHFKLISDLNTAALNLTSEYLEIV